MSPASTRSRLDRSHSEAGAAHGSSVIAHPTVVTAVDFAKRIGLRISAPTLRAAFAACPNAPTLRLAEVVEVFDRLGIPNAAFRASPEDLPGMPLPLVAGLTSAANDHSEAGPVLVVLLESAERGVRLAHPLTGEQWIAWPEFAERWNGNLLAADARAAPGEPDFDRRIDAEQAERERYRRSIRIIDELLAPEECEALIDHCEAQNLFVRSVVKRQSGDVLTFISAARTSESALVDEAALPLASTIRARAAALVGVDIGDIEDLQCVRYQRGQQFAAHVDGRHRTFTLLVYLNDAFEGGETVFPDLELAIVPRTGQGVLFRNVDTSGAEIAWARHLGAPPRAGVKYACNIWIRCRPDHAEPAHPEDGGGPTLQL